MFAVGSGDLPSSIGGLNFQGGEKLGATVEKLRIGVTQPTGSRGSKALEESHIGNPEFVQEATNAFRQRIGAEMVAAMARGDLQQVMAALQSLGVKHVPEKALIH